jgi:hypothetical protein
MNSSCNLSYESYRALPYYNEGMHANRSEEQMAFSPGPKPDGRILVLRAHAS